MSSRERLRRKNKRQDEAGSEAPELVREALRGPGRPLDAATRARTEPHFGHDFSQVRIHTDEQAATSAEAVRARAYTSGSEIVFGAGEYQPETSEGQRLIAHELTHVAQNELSGVAPDLSRVTPPDHPSELEAMQTSALSATPRLSAQPVGIALDRRRGEPDATVTDDPETGTRSIVFHEGLTIGEGGPDPETQREMDIARAAAGARTRADGYLNGHQIEVLSAVRAFEGSAQGEIDAMDDDLSDYWGLLPILAGAAGSILTAWIPGANLAIGAALAVAVEGAIQTAVTAEVNRERGDAKQEAKRAISVFANRVDNAQSAEMTRIKERLRNEILTLSVTDDNARLLLASGTDDSLDQFIELLGIPDPTKHSPYGEILAGLETEFAAWVAKAQFQQGMTDFWRMVSEAPGTEKHAEMQNQIQEAQAQARRRADEAARQRRPQGSQ